MRNRRMRYASYRALFVATGSALMFAKPLRAGNYSDTVISTPGLSAYWRLSETANNGTGTTWADSSGNGHTGSQTIHPARVPTLGLSGPRPSDGFMGFESDNTADGFARNQSILAQDAPSLNPGTGDFTMESWFQTTNTTTATISILGKHDATGSANGYLMMTNYWDVANHDAAARFRNAGATKMLDVPAPGFATTGNDGAWHYIAAVLHRTGNGSSYADSGMSVYLDGTLAGALNSTILDGVNITNSQEFAIGAANRDGSSGYVGSLDEVALYSRALSATEIAAHYNAALTLGTVGSQWNVDADGNWSDSGNWQGGVPNSAGATANFGSVIKSSRIVTVDSAQIVGTINFNSSVSYNIVGSAAITMSVSGGPSGINVSSGNHTIAAPVVLNSSSTLNVSAGSSLAVTGDLSSMTNGTNILGRAGTGGLNLHPASLQVRGGTLKLASGLDPIRAGSLSIVSGSTLDISDGKLIYDYANGGTPDAARLSAVQSLIASGYAAGNWNGSGITSSNAADVAASSPNLHKTAIGYAEASATGLGSFAGVVTDGDMILTRYTYAGDANLDGVVNSLDFTLLAAHFNQSLATWVNGDSNYDGVVNALDFNELATNYGAAAITSPAFGTIVPEPTSPLFVLLGMAALSFRSAKSSRVRSLVGSR